MKQTKIKFLYDLFLEQEEFSTKELMRITKLPTANQLTGYLSHLRKGSLNKYNGEVRRMPLNIQSVSINGDTRKRKYKLLTEKNALPEELKEVSIREQKIISTRGNTSWKPSVILMAKKIPHNEFKKLILVQQAAFLDSFLLENGK